MVNFVDQFVNWSTKIRIITGLKHYYRFDNTTRNFSFSHFFSTSFTLLNIDGSYENQHVSKLKREIAR